MVIIDIQTKLRVALGTMKDQASIGKAMMYNHQQRDGFSNIEIAILRATSHGDNTIDDKYMHEILFHVSNSKGSIPFLAERISRRLCKTKDSLVALKTLVLVHRLLRGGNRTFEQEFCKAHVSGHLQITIMRDFCVAKNFYDPLVCFLHKYASYLEERMSWLINQGGKLEPIMSKGLEFRRYGEKSFDMAFRILPKCQILIDKVLEFSPCDILRSNHHHNHHSFTHVAMSNILRESFPVYMTFSEGIEALVNMFFELESSAKSLACEILKKGSIQSQKLLDLYQTCKKLIENKNLEYPFVQIINMNHIMELGKFSCQQNQVEASNISLSSISSIPKFPPISSLFNSSKEIELEVTSKERKKDEEKVDLNLPTIPTLFSWTLETKISKVWVVFEDEVPSESNILPKKENPGDVNCASMSSKV